MKRADSDLHMPQDGAENAPAAEPMPDGDWLALSEAHAETAPTAAVSPRRGGLGRLAAAWRYLADPAERHALMQYAKGSIAHAVQTLRHPPMTAVMAAPAAPAASADGRDDPAGDEEPFDPQAARRRLDEALAALSPRGEVHVPANLRALDRLLSDPPPANDFQASDLLHDCFPRGTRHSDNRVLLAVARNLTRRFGRPGRLPIAAGKAWTMLDPAIFADQMAAQLAEIARFVLGWQAEHKEFLILEFAEIELIEFLFEHLHPRRHGGLLLKVMDFKVLSARRTGLLRRIPARVRRRLQHAGSVDPRAALAYAQDSATLLQIIERQAAFRPVAEAAAISRTEIEKMLARLAPPPVPAPPPAAGPPPAPAGTPARPSPPRPDISQIMRALGPAADPSIPRSAAPQPQPQPAAVVGLAAAAPVPTAISAAAPPTPLQTLSVGTAPAAPTSPASPARLPVPTATGRRRFGPAVKADAVMRVLRGEAPERVAAAIGIDPGVLDHWRETFLAGGSASLALHGAKARPRAAEPSESPRPRRKRRADADGTSIEELKAKVQALIRTVEDLSGRIQVLPAQTPAPALPPPASTARPFLPAAPAAAGEPPPGFPSEDENPPERIKRTRRPPQRDRRDKGHDAT